jgi:serine protease Do
MKANIEIRRWAAVAVIALVALVGGLTAAMITAGHEHVPIFVTAKAATLEPTGQLVTFAPIVKRASPAVVNISSTTIIKASSHGAEQNNPFFNDPLFRQFFGNQNPFYQVPRDRRESALGSGVIVSPDGYILTNNHVIQGATSIKVTLADHRVLPAKVVGADKPSDIAVIKIDATDLPVLPMSDSSKAQVGDVCLAIGDPFGIGQTVTMGIVSATGRSLGGAIENYEDFIQTDAAINPGNSGGALINSRGELIGINTAILTSNTGFGGEGGSVGVGFAIPINMARGEMTQLIKNGKVTRGYMGAVPQDITPALQQAFNLHTTSGAVLSDIEAGKPASKAGLKPGDVVESVNGKPIADANALRLLIASIAPGTTVDMHILRNGEPMNMKLTLAERPTNLEAENGNGNNQNNGGENALQGVTVQNMTPDLAQQLQLPATTKGVVVTDVDEASAAAEAGLQRGDVIEQVDRQPVNNKADFNRLVSQAPKSGPVLLLVNRQGLTTFVAIENK